MSPFSVSGFTLNLGFSESPSRQWIRISGMRYLVGLLLLIALPLLYGGAYWFMLNGRITTVDFARELVLDEQPSYRFGGYVSAAFFAPANAIDQNMWPSKWKKESRLQIDESISN